MKTIWIAFTIAMLVPLSMRGQGTAFTYQGRLDNNGAAVNGTYDFRFRLSEDPSGNTYFGSPVTATLSVTNGLFATTIDFGPGSFTGSNFWLEIDVRTNGASGYADLSPLQPITPAPYATFAGAASNLTGMLPASQLSGSVPTSQLSGALQNANLSGTYGSAVVFNNANDNFTGNFIGNGSGLTNLNAWGLSGNSGTTAGPNFLGTTDNQPVELHVNTMRAMRYEFGGVSAFAASLGYTNLTGAPNVVAGSPINFVMPGVVGAVIGGGGSTNFGETGYTNGSAADFAVVVGGLGNQVGQASIEAFIGGGLLNIIDASNYASIIVGGQENQIETNAESSFIGGGYDNKIQFGAGDSVIGGGAANEIGTNSYQSVVAGGDANDLGTNSMSSTIGGGEHNIIGANSSNSTIGGGRENGVGQNSPEGTVGGGGNNNVDDGSTNSTVSGGYNNNISGSYSTIPGGEGNYILANYCLAAGHLATAQNNGVFIWADNSGGYFYSERNNEFAVRANGGVRFTSGTNAANQTVSWSPGAGSWSFTSDRNTKENIQPVDGCAVLEKLARVPINEWQYVGYQQRHLGPMAQDFHKEFPLNDNDKSLNETDLHGVALAAIQGLNAKLDAEIGRNRQKDAEIDDLRRQVEELKVLIKSVHP
jgi:trimeric autotransporter adhesin